MTLIAAMRLPSTSIAELPPAIRGWTSSIGRRAMDVPNSATESLETFPVSPVWASSFRAMVAARYFSNRLKIAKLGQGGVAAHALGRGRLPFQPRFGDDL